VVGGWGLSEMAGSPAREGTLSVVWGGCTHQLFYLRCVSKDDTWLVDPAVV
jgi:hypothetical protein